MIRRTPCNWSAVQFFSLIGAASLGLGFGANPALAVGLTYVDASVLSNLSGDTFTTTGVAVSDGHWDTRSYASGVTVIESGGTTTGGGETGCVGCTAEGAPEIKQTITIPVAGNYDIYAVFWSADAENWHLRTGVASGNLTLYNRTGVNSAVIGTYGAISTFDVLPPANGSASPGKYYHDGNRSMLLGYAGTVTVDGIASTDVFINDLPGTTTARSGFDGVAYVPAGTPISMKATVNRTTGQVIIDNPTSGNYQIRSYTVSSAGGTLNSATWNTIHGHTDGAANGGDSTFDTDPWDIIAPTPPTLPTFTVALTESENASGAGSGGNINADGGVLDNFNLGNIWQRTPIQDLVITVNMADLSTGTNVSNAVVPIQYTGTGITAGDFDGNAAIDLTDFQTLLNGLQSSPVGTAAQTYQLGDMNADLKIDFNDWQAFRAAYDLANGAGAFSQMLASVPEPSSLLLLIVCGALTVKCRVRRPIAMAIALVWCLIVVNPSRAVPFLLVDCDDRQADADAPGPAGSNTVAGFGSFQIPGTGAGTSVASVTGTVNGYTITMASINSSGVSSTLLQDRDRALPSTTPNLNQLYDDFIFVNDSAANAGMDLTIVSTGAAPVAMLPNTQYQVSIYSFDPITTPVRSGQWTDANYFNAPLFVGTFDGVVAPTTDDRYKYMVIAKTDATGKLFLKERNLTAALSAFVNGLEVGLPDQLTLEVNTTTGATRILNEQATSFDVSYYEIRSGNGSLKLGAGGWAALDDGEAGPDPLGSGWDKVPVSNSSLLSEVNLNSVMTVAPSGSVALGNAFQSGFPQDVRFYFASPTDAKLRMGAIKYVTGPVGVPGDYNNDTVVDGADYVVWRKNNGTNTQLANEVSGITPGQVTIEDFNAWRARFGNTSGSGSALGGGAAVPEPTTLGLFALAIAIAAVGRRRTI